MMFMCSEPKYFEEQIHFWHLDVMHFMECDIIVEQYSISNKYNIILIMI
jgi:hypothetical protein